MDTSRIADRRAEEWPNETLLLHAVWLLAHEVVSLRDDVTRIRAAVGLRPRQLPTLDLSERQAILDALEAAQWVQHDAAKTLGISERVMVYKLQQLGLDALSRKVRRRQ